MSDKPLDCVGIDPARSEVGKHDFRPREIPPLKPLSHADVAGAMLDQSVSLAGELDAVTRERDALKAALDSIGHALMIGDALDIRREALAMLASGEFRKPVE